MERHIFNFFYRIFNRGLLVKNERKSVKIDFCLGLFVLKVNEFLVEIRMLHRLAVLV